jgi:membrane-associated tyrosine/threonine-specific cdc2-inhibitory kinase
LYLQTELCVRSLDLPEGRYGERKIPEAECWRFLIYVLLALRHMHQVGLVHMDVKPDNVFEGSDGRLKLGDFGICHFAGLPSDYLQNGDLFYAAPEVVVRTVSGVAADMFSLGLSVLELVTGTNLPSYSSNIGGWHALVFLIIFTIFILLNY